MLVFFPVSQILPDRWLTKSQNSRRQLLLETVWDIFKTKQIIDQQKK